MTNTPAQRPFADRRFAFRSVIISTALSLLATAAQAAGPDAQAGPETPPKDAPAATPDAPPPAPAGEPAPAAKDTTPKAPEDLLRGPKVPEVDVKSDRPYVEGAKGSEKLSKPVLEQRVYFRTIDLMGFDAATKEKIDGLRVAFVDRLEAFQKDAQKRRGELEAKRKLANPAEPPSEEFKKAMNAIEAARPKLSELQAEVDAVLGAGRALELKTKFAEELKRVRAEQTRIVEEERKRRRAEIDEQKKSRPSGGGMPSEGGSGDEMNPSSPKSSMR